jgi:hypothetical protein
VHNFDLEAARLLTRYAEQSRPVQFPPRDFCLSTLGMFELGLDLGDAPPLKSDRPDSGQVICESVFRHASSRGFRAEGIEPGCTSVDSVTRAG